MGPRHCRGRPLARGHRRRVECGPLRTGVLDCGFRRPAGSYVREEAELAKHRGVLLPLLLDRVAPPFGFGEVQALDLVDWDGRIQSPKWQAVSRAVQAILEGKQQPPTPLRRRRWAWAGGAVAVVFSAIGLLADFTGLHAALCKPEGSMNALCTWVGLGPSDDEVAAWTQAKSAATSGPLKAYLSKYSAGFFATEAQARLAACQKVVDASWVSYRGSAPLVVPSGPIKAALTRAAAKQAMQPEVQRDADDACSAAALSELYRPEPGAGPEVPDRCRDCRPADGGWRCRYDGKIVCPQERRQTVEREACTPG